MARDHASVHFKIAIAERVSNHARERIEKSVGELKPSLAMTTAAVSRLISHPPLFVVAMALAGCWVAPVATVQPKGEPRLIQSAIAVESVKRPAVVSSVNRSAGTIVLRVPGRAETSTYRVGPRVSSLKDIKAGDVVQATVAEDLAVYVLRDGQLSGGGGTIAAKVRVLAVDPSYRLLTLQYSDGRNETFKVPPGTKLERMEAGDSVVIRPVAVLALRRKG
jgi:hypothetical protein